MAMQTTLENYFSSRKRPAVDDLKKVNEKVLILDKNESNITSIQDDNIKRNIIFKESPQSSRKLIEAPKLHRRTPKTVPRSFIIGRSDEMKSGTKSSAKKSLLASFNATKNAENTPSKKDKPIKKKARTALLSAFEATEMKQQGAKKIDILDSNSDVQVVPEVSEVKVPKNNTETVPKVEKGSDESLKDGVVNSALDKLNNKDLSLSCIKKKLIRSSRLEDLKNALKKVNEGYDKLKAVQSKEPSVPITPTKSPNLSSFKTIEVEVSSPSKMSSPPMRVPDSPSLLRRAVFLSPTKTAPNTQPYVSPRKLFSDSLTSAAQKSPDTSTGKYRSFERFYALACSGKPALTLPSHYRMLAETFRAVDTVVSIMHNRNELVLFSKLKLSVQQLSKKNFLVSHLGQIATVFPKAYAFSQEKVRVLGNQNENYELVVKPLFESRAGEGKEDKVKDLMSPSVVLDRKREFYNRLLEIVKNSHEDFLKTLDPPLEVPKEKLTRWHPEFDVDNCPEIKASAMPEPPNIEKLTSAKDVLSKARELFVAYPRMEKALEKLSEKNPNPTPASKAIPALANALKGIPKSLLEKVRARQAAKAVELLTRNPEENKRRFELTRLPELARILRNIFVTEKKNIIAKSVVIQKMCESYREIMDHSDMAHHLDLLREAVPGWIILSNVQNKDFVKLCKQTDLTVVLSQINQLVAKNQLH